MTSHEQLAVDLMLRERQEVKRVVKRVRRMPTNKTAKGRHQRRVLARLVANRIRKRDAARAKRLREFRKERGYYTRLKSAQEK